jgi:hypothetical protein
MHISITHLSAMHQGEEVAVPATVQLVDGPSEGLPLVGNVLILRIVTQRTPDHRSTVSVCLPADEAAVLAEAISRGVAMLERRMEQEGSFH